MLIPLGHNQGVFSWPYATFGIMAACLAAHIYTITVEPPQAELETLLESRSKLEEQIGEASLAQVRGALSAEMGRADSGATMRAATAESLLIELEILDQEIEAWAEKDLSYRWAYHVWDRASVSWFMYACLHGGWSHLLFNMLFLWLAGSAIEDRWGRIPFVIFYLGGAAAAAFAFKLINPNTAAGLVGASGAVAAAMGAFLVCCYSSKIRMFFFGYLPGRGFRATRFWLPTYVALPAWFLVEAFWSWYEAEGLVSGTAHSAHMGGFGFGVAVALVARLSRFESRFLLRSEHVKDRAANRNRPVELERAEQFVANGSYSAAIACLTRLFERDPTQVEAGVQLVEIGLSMNDRKAVANQFGAVVGHLALRNDSEKLVGLLSKGVAMGLHQDLSERAYAQGVQALLARDDLDTAKTLLSELVRAYPNSAFLPRLLWTLADPNASQGDPAGQREALTILAERFPMDPFGQQASLALAELREAPTALSEARPAAIEASPADRVGFGLPLAQPGPQRSHLRDAELSPAGSHAAALPPANPVGVEPCTNADALELSVEAHALELSADTGPLELSLEAGFLEVSAHMDALELSVDTDALELSTDSHTFGLPTHTGALELPAEIGALELPTHEEELSTAEGGTPKAKDG